MINPEERPGSQMMIRLHPVVQADVIDGAAQQGGPVSLDFGLHGSNEETSGVWGASVEYTAKANAGGTSQDDTRFIGLICLMAPQALLQKFLLLVLNEATRPVVIQMAPTPIPTTMKAQLIP